MVLDYSHVEAATANAAFLGLALALGSHFEVSFDGRQRNVQPRGRPLAVLAPFCSAQRAFRSRRNSIRVGTMVAALASSALSLDKEAGNGGTRGASREGRSSY